MTYLPPVNGGRINATIGGNTAGAGALVSSGTLTLAGGNNVTLSQNGNAITISGGAGGGSNTFGMSNLGNTSGTTGVISGSALRYAFAGGNNVTLSQSINAASATLTISAANQTVQTQNLHNVTLGGNTSGVMAQVSSGTLTLAGGNNITLSQNGNAVSIIGGAGGGGGLGGLANSQATYTSGTVNLLEGGGALTIASTTGQKFNFSVPQTSSLVATGIVNLASAGNNISIGASQSAQTQNLHNITLAGNTSGTLAQISSGTLTLAGGNNVTLSQSGNAITISAGAGGGGGGVAVANSQATYSSGTVNILEGGGAITIATSAGGQSLKVSVPAVSSLVGVNGISVSTAGSTINIDGAGVGGGATYSYFNPQDAYVQTVGQQGQGTLHIQPTQAPNVTFDRVVFPVVFSGGTASTGSATLSMWMGFYTRTASTLSLLTSYSTSVGVSHSGTANSSQNVGLKVLTMGASSSLSAGQYFVGILSRTTSATAGSNLSISQIVASQQNSNLAGFWGQAVNATMQYTRGLGAYTATTSAIPSSVAISQLNGTASMVLRQPMFYVANGTF